MPAANERTGLLGPREESTTATHGGWFTRAVAALRADRGRMAAAAVAFAVSVIIMVALVIHEESAVAPVVSSVYPQEFDVIVVGGGPAGSVVSKLLSDDASKRVLLIEAGDATQVELGGKKRINVTSNTKNLTPFDVPFYWTSVANTPSVHWDYPDVNVAKALGGCGIHNAMLYVRALPSDLSRWDMQSWTWEKAFEIYKGMESFDGPNVSYHGTSGTVRTSPPPPPDPLSEHFVQACEEAGIPRTTDFNAPHGRYGAGFYDFNTRDGIRESAARRFLGPILKEKRANFKLMLNTHVKKVNINDEMTATGVDVELNDGTLQTIRTTPKGQVIVTAGAINTPKVLMLSGLGHSDDLTKLGLPVKKHLPRVGMNLQDHPVLALKYESPLARAVDVGLEMDKYFRATQNEFANTSSYGMMGSAGISAGAFLIPPGATLPEIQLTFFPRKSEPHISNSSELQHDPQILITVALLHPSARNRIVLTTEDKKTYTPRIASEVPDQEAEHLRSDDIRKLAWGVGVVREIAAALGRYTCAVRTRLLLVVLTSFLLCSTERCDWQRDFPRPGRRVARRYSILQWVPNAVFRNSHWVGSAAMGNSSEAAVVDHRLRVFGVQNLRVADASVIPTIPNGNVHSSVLMVASHAAELIRSDEAAEKPAVERIT